MDYLRLDPAIDTDPKLEEAGWWATRVYELLLKVSAQRDLRGYIRPEFQSPAWLARRWGAPADVETFIPAAVVALVKAKALELKEDGSLYIVGWEHWYPTPKSNAERQADWRGRHRNESNGRNGESVTETEVTPTEPDCTDCTPLHPTEPIPTAAGAAAGAKSVWERIQEQRNEAGLRLESDRPRKFLAWWASVVLAFPVDTLERLACAHRAFCRDPAFKAKNWGTDVFMRESVYQRRMPAPHEQNQEASAP